MVDPFDFILRESTVSASQEERLNLIPGWEEHQDSGSPSPLPSQAPLALSRLCGSGSSSSSDEEEHEPIQASAFCIQEPLEWASPEACQDDSYNPAFESDRSRSLSPLAPLQVYGDLWASRLITQSQNDFGMSHFRVSDLPLAEEVPKKNPPQAAEVCRQGKNAHFLQGTNGQAQASKLVDAQQQVVVTRSRNSSRDVPNGLCVSVDHATDCHKTDTDGNVHVLNIVEPAKPSPADQLPSICDVTSRKRCLDAAVDEPAMEEATLRSRIDTTADGAEDNRIQNERKHKDEEGDCGLATTAPKLREPNFEQQHRKLANEVNHHKVKGPQSTMQAGEDCVAGSSKMKCPLPFVSDKEIFLTRKMEKATCDEAEMAKDNATIDDTVTRVFPESVMDVVMLLSETAHSPSPHDPDFLSIVMSTGVSLSLPYRDCSGRLISSKSVSTYKGYKNMKAGT